MQWSYLESFQDSPSQYLKKSFTIPTQQKVCTEGQKYNPTNDTCVSCEDGTYQNETNHTLTSCKTKKHDCSGDRYSTTFGSSKISNDPVCESHPSLDDLRTQCSGYILEDKYNTKINEKNKKSPLTTKDINNLCLEHSSLDDLRRDCSGYILETEYNTKINEKNKKAPLTTKDINNLCLEHTQWDNKSTLGTCKEPNKYYDKSQYDKIIKNKNSGNITLDEICLTIPYYPLNVKEGDDKYSTKKIFSVFLKNTITGKYLNIKKDLGFYKHNAKLVYSNYANTIPITWDKTNETIVIESKNVKKRFSGFRMITESEKVYAKLVSNNLIFVKQLSALPVTQKENGKLFITGTDIEINLNNCNNTQYKDFKTNTCIDKVTCDNGKYFVFKGMSHPGTCQWCPDGKYKNSGQNRNSCSNQKTCPNGQQLVDASNTSPGICKWCPDGKYKNSGQNRNSCLDQNKCPDGHQLVGSSRKSPGSCQRCPAGQYKNSGQNRNSCSDQKTCPNGQQLVGSNNKNPGTCQRCPAGQYKNSGQNRNSCAACSNIGGYQVYSGEDFCYIPVYKLSSDNGYYNGDWFEYDKLTFWEIYKDKNKNVDFTRAINNLKKKFFIKFPNGLAPNKKRFPDVLMFRRSDMRAIAVWYNRINYDRDGDYISWSYNTMIKGD